MDFYVRYYEKKVKGEDDNPTIGIILFWVWIYEYHYFFMLIPVFCSITTQPPYWSRRIL